jgi:hypothetical protein
MLKARPQGGVWGREFLGSLALGLFFEEADPDPASLVAYHSLNKRKKMQHFYVYLIS